MQDRFKFRAKLKGMDKWIYGAYLKMLPYQPNPIGKIKPLETEYKHLIITEGSADWGMPRGIEAYEVIPETVGQSTGLKDKNGRLIYEGDIISVKIRTQDVFNVEEYYSENYKGEIIFKEGEIAIRVIDTKKQPISLYYYANGCEVIGNIYENPELLEVEND